MLDAIAALSLGSVLFAAVKRMNPAAGRDRRF